MDVKYINIGTVEDKLIEECAEVIQSIIKIKRFGPLNYHPDRPHSNNLKEMFSEIEDLKLAIKNIEKEYAEKKVYCEHHQPGFACKVFNDGENCKAEPCTR